MASPLSALEAEAFPASPTPTLLPPSRRRYQVLVQHLRSRSPERHHFLHPLLGVHAVPNLSSKTNWPRTCQIGLLYQLHLRLYRFLYYFLLSGTSVFLENLARRAPDCRLYLMLHLIRVHPSRCRTTHHLVWSPLAPLPHATGSLELVRLHNSRPPEMTRE